MHSIDLDAGKSLILLIECVIDVFVLGCMTTIVNNYLLFIAQSYVFDDLRIT